MQIDTLEPTICCSNIGRLHSVHIVTLCQSLFALMSLMLDSHLYKRRDSSVGMYQLYQLERTIEFELKN